MLRIITMLVLAALLAGCNVVFIPIPIDLPTVSPTPTPAASPTGTAAEWDAFAAAYEGLDEPYKALMAQFDAMAFDDPVWSADTVRLAQEWRAAVDALRDMPQPHGDRWVEAWPVLMQAMDEYAYAAGAIENAAAFNEPTLLEPARTRLINGVNLTGEAMRLLGEE